MSLVLYNPLEAGVLLLASWFFKPKYFYRAQFNIKEFIIRCYIIGTLNYIVQIPERFVQQSIFYGMFMILTYFVIAPLILEIFGYKNNFLILIFILLIFNISLDCIISICHFETCIANIHNNLLYELCANLIIKFWQICILLILLGVKNMFKILLKSTAKKNLGKMVASTIKGYGETKLSAKLAKEVKESK